MDDPTPIQMLYKPWYLLDNDWSDYRVWLQNIGLQQGRELDWVPTRPTKPMEGKWYSLEKQGRWLEGMWSEVAELAKECSRGLREGGLLGSAGFQKDEWARTGKWMRRQTMRAAVHWQTALAKRLASARGGEEQTPPAPRT